MNRPIEELGFDNRTYNCLKRANINTVGELCNKTETEIMRIRLMGKYTLEKLINKMQECGLAFKEEVG